LILGGGDGYPAMYALRYENAHVTNVEIDETLVKFIKTNKYTKKLTNNAFNNPMLKMINEDAYDYTENEAIGEMKNISQILGKIQSQANRKKLMF
jgi:spermidine synthase